MKIVVTGAAGFIGSHLCERLALDGHEVVGVDSFDSFLYSELDKRRHAAELIESTLGADFQLVEADICDRDAIDEILGSSVDLVCHLAALAGVRPSLLAPGRYMRTNVEGTAVIMEACRDAEIDRVVFASSSSVYGARGEVIPFRESDPCLHPASPYAASKLFGEIILSTYHDLYGIGASCLRFFTVFGPRQRPDMAIHKFVHAIASEDPITIFGDGRSRRDYTYIDDIVDGVVAAIEQTQADRFDVFNLGGGAVTELNDLVSLIEEVVGKDAIVKRLGNQQGDVPLTLADTSLARERFGYQPKVSVQEGLERYWRQCRDSRDTHLDPMRGESRCS